MRVDVRLSGSVRLIDGSADVHYPTAMRIRQRYIGQCGAKVALAYDAYAIFKRLLHIELISLKVIE